MAPWAASAFVRVRVRKGDGSLVDISADVRTIQRARPLEANRGRQNETDVIQPGRLQFVIDNSSGAYTPGRSAASCELTLNMPVYVDETIGYRTFPVFSGLLQLPDVVEQLEGVDNLITVTAIDAKQMLDNGRRFVSTLGEYIMAATPSTLLHYYPLNEPQAPFRDAYGDGADFVLGTTRSTLMTANTAQPTWTPNGAVQARGDDIRGVSFAPATSDAGGVGFPQLASGYKLDAVFATAASPSGAVSFAAGVPLTVIMWVSLTDQYDEQTLTNFGIVDSVSLPTQESVVFLRRVTRAASAGADAGQLWGSISNSLTGAAKSPGWFVANTAGIQPVAFQLTYSPNTLTVWAGAEEYVATTPFGTLTSPQYIDGFTLGAITGGLAHFQVHVGDYTRADFLAQFRAGTVGLAGQRTDERIATALSYAGADIPAVLDEGSTWMQQAGLAGQTPGQVIDNAVQTERGRGFVGPDGVYRFHARTRAYNL